MATGVRELESPEEGMENRVRRTGGGRKSLVEKDDKIRADLESLIEPTSCGDPETPLKWTTKSLRNLLAEMRQLGHHIQSHETIRTLLEQSGYRLQGNSKELEGGNHPDRDAQFRYIYEQTLAFQAENQPVISVDAKKKELVGNFKNPGQEWRPEGKPREVNVYDFPSLSEGDAHPYGAYDIGRNEGWVSVGVDHQTATFAVSTIEHWWREMGTSAYPEAQKLLVVADGGGSNGQRNRLWKAELQGLADQTGLTIQVCHLPPGTSKWNKIEHRMFLFISMNWRGKPLTSYQFIVDLISQTTTSKGLKIKAHLDPLPYPTGRKPRPGEMESLNISPSSFHPEWNYTIAPQI